MTLPDTIEITITEEDRQKAGKFHDNCNCLVATAIKRLFPGRKVSEGVDQVFIGKSEFVHERFVSTDCHYVNFYEKPHYSPAVGKKLTLTKVK